MAYEPFAISRIVHLVIITKIPNIVIEDLKQNFSFTIYKHFSKNFKFHCNLNTPKNTQSYFRFKLRKWKIQNTGAHHS